MSMVFHLNYAWNVYIFITPYYSIHSVCPCIYIYIYILIFWDRMLSLQLLACSRSLVMFIVPQERQSTKGRTWKVPYTAGKLCSWAHIENLHDTPINDLWPLWRSKSFAKPTRKKVNEIYSKIHRTEPSVSYMQYNIHKGRIENRSQVPVELVNIQEVRWWMAWRVTWGEHFWVIVIKENI